ncbi:hypothetical protein HOLleu_02464 [Holothuria leucospilota]|uniref:Uncharacterized protein n=1 Tax=Holothuria leucospilota TaxID=206669 RepID=A0A9Q1CQQ8_HOLLE|nr:hypothetical protein HOLleu_02464 [Holothuria leucospilota]
MMIPIKGEDTIAMKDYLTFCVVFSNAINKNDTHKTDQTESIMKLVGKIPYQMRERWQMHVYKIKESSHKLANFHDYVKFFKTG